MEPTQIMPQTPKPRVFTAFHSNPLLYAEGAEAFRGCVPKVSGRIRARQAPDVLWAGPHELVERFPSQNISGQS